MDFEDGAFLRAAAHFARAVELDPTAGPAHGGLGSALMELGRFAECADAFAACLDVDPGNVGCLQNLGICRDKAALSRPAPSP